MQIKIRISIFFFVLFFPQNHSQAQVSKVAGFYADNFPAYGFFMTFIQLNPDSTFKYEWGGDMQDDRAIGIYKVINDTVLLTYLPFHCDTSYFMKDSGSIDSSITYLFPFKHPIKLKSYELSSYIGHRPLKFYYKHKKLLYVWISGGKIVYKCENYSRRKRFLLLGEHYRKIRKCYMARRGNTGKMFEEW